jgi:biotin operon repressor
MSMITQQDRLALKTPEASFLHVLQNDFDLSYIEAREVVATARDLLGLDRPTEQARLGQVRLVVASAKAPFGPPLSETARVEVTLTVDAGQEDGEVLMGAGREALRQGRILRLLDEALDQGGVLTEEDLARVLHVTRRTIERDVRALRQAGHLIHTRGQLKGVGRGQTHKVRIIQLWLEREGYDKIARWVHHSPQSIKRYVNTFMRVVALQRQGRPAAEIGFLVGASPKLVTDYLEVYQQAQAQPQQMEKLEEELARISGLGLGAKKEGRRA